MAWGAILVFHLAVAFRGPGAGIVQGDPKRYQGYSSLMLGAPVDVGALGWGEIGALGPRMALPAHLSGPQLPYRDFAVEYPPGVLPWILAPRLVSDSVSGYSTLFTVQMALCWLLALGCAAVWLIPQRQQTAFCGAGLLAMLLLGPVATTRLDVLVALFLTLAAVAAKTRRPALCGGILALATAVKLLPLALLPAGSFFWWRSRRAFQFLLGFTAVALALFLPAWLLGGERFLVMFEFHAQRPIQIESVWGSLGLLLQSMGQPVGLASNYGSTNVVLPGGQTVVLQTVSALLGVLGILLTTALYALRSRAEDEPDVEALVRVWLAVLLVLVVTGKVLSPQYLCWFFPLLFLLKGRYLKPCGLLACGLTFLVFPLGYATDHDAWWPLPALLARNATLIWLLWLMLQPWTKGLDDRRPGWRGATQVVPGWPLAAWRPGDRVCQASVFLTAFGLYATTATPLIGFGDSGETVAAGQVLGVPHPPGYPLYTLLVAGAQRLLPFFDPAYATNLLSCVFAAATVTVLFGWIRRSSGSLLGAWVGAGLLAVSPTFWYYANYAKVYALSTFLVLLCWQFMLGRQWRAFGIVVGLGLAAHYQTTCVFVPVFFYLTLGVGWAAASTVLMFSLALGSSLSGPPYGLLAGAPLLLSLLWMWRDRKRVALGQPFGFRDMATIVATALPGLLFYLYLPLRARANPALNWGDPDTLSRFWRSVRMHDFDLLHGLSSLPTTLARLGLTGGYDGYLQTLGQQYLGGLGLAIAALGAFSVYRKERRLFHAVVLGILLNVGWVVLYYKSPIDGYTAWVLAGFYLPSNVLLAFLIGHGAAALAAILSHRFSEAARLQAALLGALLLLPVLGAAAGWKDNDRSRDTLASDYGHNVLSMAEPNALIVVQSDDGAFPLWYWQMARGYRQDVTVVFFDTLGQDWYQAQLRQQGIDVGPGDAPAQLAADLVRRYLPTRAVYADFYAGSLLRPLLGDQKASYIGLLYRYGSADWPIQLDSLAMFGVLRADTPKNPAAQGSLLAYGWAYNMLGIRALEAGDYDEAMSLWRQASEIAPQREVTAHLLMARAAAARGQRERALEHVYEALRLQPEQPEALSLRGQLSQAPPAQPTRVESDLASLGSAEARALNQQGVEALFATPPNPGKARQLWRQAAQTDPKLAEPRINLGNSFLDEKKPAEALTEYRAALALDPGIAALHLNMGRAYQMLGQTAQSRREYEQALKLAVGPDGEDIRRRALDRLRRLGGDAPGQSSPAEASDEG